MSEDLNNNQVRYWIGGYLWENGKESQYDVFMQRGIWVNGYENIPKTNGNIVKKGDYIALKGEKFIRAIGKVIEDAKDKTVKVDWFIKDEQIKYGQGFPSAFAELANDTNARRTVIDRIKQYEDKKMELQNKCKNLLEHSRNIILHGAPGTGKTYLARQIAESMGAETCFVQFHPSYDYTDFVEGLRPVNKEGSKEIGFERMDGVFKKFCKKALQGKNEKYVFIIDEINRGEMSKIFGELFFSIDPGYRGEKGKISTQYQNLVDEDDAFYDGFYVPENVYIIGTMNDIDRNVESMDFAIRRRFAFKEIEAKNTQESILANMPNKGELIERMNNLNNAISGIEGLSSAYHIGAAYFLKYDSSFDELWNYHLKPLLQEYLRGMEGAEQKLKDLEAAYKDEEDHKEQ